MLMKAEPIFAAVEAAAPPRPLFLLGPGGRRFDQSVARELAGRRRVQPAVRALRGRRPPGARAPRRRRAERRRRRAVGRRGRGVPGGRCGRRACFPARWATRSARSPRASASAGCSRSRSTRVRRRSAGWDVPEVLLSGNHAPDRTLAARPGAAPHGRRPPRRHRRRVVASRDAGATPVGRVPSGPVSLTSPRRTPSRPRTERSRTICHESHRPHRQRPVA